jgi:hypothetical protein
VRAPRGVAVGVALGSGVFVGFILVLVGDGEAVEVGGMLVEVGGRLVAVKGIGVLVIITGSGVLVGTFWQATRTMANIKKTIRRTCFLDDETNIIAESYHQHPFQTSFATKIRYFAHQTFT